MDLWEYFYSAALIGLGVMFIMGVINLLRKPDPQHIHEWSNWGFDFNSTNIFAFRMCTDSSCKETEYEIVDRVSLREEGLRKAYKDARQEL
ncbi:membrane protein [Arthrobacter phage GoCrazy]|uniref:Uncharacterized protein n=1 Tax=Arthrobacter phage KeaneyLin TaxID=2250412 RepID=A0A345KMF7_9CAUD|nr:hypothetical protein PQB83_gp71 [Arthrobacter phage KeaneyLin]AXH44209.1 hypothetical protein SEA_KEANEYLIN_71 [Arthrobacter phage KeaneyLin]QXO13570.1 membrane protein [Arthrobacter phage GoCrazy]